MSGCVDRFPNVLLCLGSYDVVKTSKMKNKFVNTDILIIIISIKVCTNN